MALEVEIEKRLPGFTLEVAFTANAQPLGILGASGAGKSMTLRSIAGVETPTRGRIALDGRVLFDSARGIRLPSRVRRVGLLFQHYALFPHLTVEQNVGFGLRHLLENERAARVSTQIAAAHLAGLERRYPATLSGGEQQRVALARALAPQPAALLLDEPFSALDTYLRGQLEHQLRETLGNYRQPTLLVSHNLEEVYRLCAELVVLDRGRVIARGAREEIFSRPPGRRAAELTGCKNFSRARATGDHEIEALDWGCRLRVAAEVRGALEHCGIRAHHLTVSPLPAGGAAGAVAAGENTVRGWVADATEGPFGVTVYLRLHQPPRDPSDYQVQAEIPRESWMALQAPVSGVRWTPPESRHRTAPDPYLVRLDPEQIMLLPD